MEYTQLPDGFWKRFQQSCRAVDRQKWLVIQQCTQIRSWWMDNVWPFRKEYSMRVSSHKLVMYLRKREAA